MPIVLSTKLLSLPQKRHLFNAGIGLVEYNAIEVKPLDLTFSSKKFDYAIFTSQNAVHIAKNNNLLVDNAFCVGEKTASLLQSRVKRIVLVEKNATELANKITHLYSNTSFSFFCSKQRRSELPDILNKNKVCFREFYLYESLKNPLFFNNKFDAVLFFSPMGVETFFEKNKRCPKAICIGKTTVSAASQYTSNVFLSNRLSVESVLIKAINILKK